MDKMLPEVAAYLQQIRELRSNVWHTLEGLNAGALNWTPTDRETNSLYVLATHAIGSEHGWLYETLGRGEKTRNRPAEFQARGDDLSALRAEFDRVAQETETLLASRTADDLETTRQDKTRGAVSERWIILHVIKHYAEHMGQMYLTRQLWEQSQAKS